ncbi:cytochrome c oxidase, cbb3-type, CcoQ subunit [Helicobacter canis]|uniref:Cytochrome c oxidase subunit Q, CcoQ n=1 Tax=Helicobacter canis TaxID=29419 RepID=A0A377J4B6_9HELI|nr:cytochrome c oxidase, cbb3-type, CcoQ subunit [Helicobacter canis]STO97169.1 cytochrome c oxidase subunit Q, CcoQ [Helicobacter canis]
MEAETIEYLRVGVYFVVTIFLIVFLYSYAVSMWRRQERGIRDYEKYGELAVRDDLNDDLIEPRITEKEQR